MKSYIIIIIDITMVIIGSFQELDVTNYNLKSIQHNFRNKFITNRRQNMLQNKRTHLLDKYLFNNTVYLDGIIHYEINENNTNFNKVKNVENELKFLLSMDGVKYVYKRGTKWRTWRELLRDGGKKIICYVCENIIKGNCSNCHVGGHWNIEEEPPCPYEIFSIKDDNQICVKNYTEYTNTTNDCPSQIKFQDLGVSCENPIETTWRIRRDYKKIKNYPTFICNGKDYCDITTIYIIDHNGIAFRLINSSNNIIYSRVMRNGGKNYACVDDCGYWDPNTKKVASQLNPLSFDLLGKKKEKREDIFNTSTSLKSTKPISIKNKVNINKHVSLLKSAGIKPKAEHDVSTTISHCKKLEKKDNDENEDEESNYED